MPNFSSLARLEVGEKFVVGWGGGGGTRDYYSAGQKKSVRISDHLH